MVGNFGRRTRRALGLVTVLGALLSVSLFAVPSASAVSAATLGSVAASPSHCDPISNGGSFNSVQLTTTGTSYVVPAGGGLLNSWSTTAGNFSDTRRLEVWRPAGTLTYTLVYIGAGQAITANSGLNTFTLTTPVLVKAGDVIGLGVTVADGGCYQNTSNSGDTFAFLGGTLPTQGNTYSGFFDLSTYSVYGQVNVSATLVPLCSTGLTAHVLSASTNAGPITGVFCVNAQGIGTYTQDGRIAPAQIIKVGTILWFQANGNNLRNSGYLNTANGASSFVQTKPVAATGKVTSLT